MLYFGYGLIPRHPEFISGSRSLGDSETSSE